MSAPEKVSGVTVSRVIRILCVGVVLCVSLGGGVEEKKDKEEKEKKEKSPKTRVYKIAQAFPYPPWDVGPLEGVSIDVLTAICEVNAPMECQFTAVPSET